MHLKKFQNVISSTNQQTFRHSKHNTIIRLTESTFEKPSQDFREGTSVTHWGVVKTTVVDGKISKIEPIPEDRRPSPNLKALAELPYAPSRIRYPMVRESYLKEGIASRDRRGEDKWIRVSWEEALDLIASELKRIYSEYGPSAVFGQSYGWKSPGTVRFREDC